MSNPAKSIRIGTMIRANAPDPATYVKNLQPHGFESIEPFFWQVMNKDLPTLASQLKDAIGDADITISTLGMFGNPLEDTEIDRETLKGWEALIDNAHLFGATTIAGFTGRIRGKRIEDSLPQFKKVWSELSRRAADKGVKLAFENCAMDGNWATGDWNIAHTPDAWEMMFNEVPADNLGLEWEPCHQMVYLIDPLPQIRKWAPKIFHVHGKDATIRWEVIREHGVFGKEKFVFMRSPGFGDTNWTDIISELRLAGWSGSIDIEGWHDPVYRDDLEMTGQVHSLNYLKQSRGGDFVANP
ncbi:sugar phosphate isomerase/epimerase [Phyllobacterium sp. OV277]|jgi:sugar phosphate isomerase/epimerase|uniref:sugar phosphate isomerase/epimerase family protein n=1 Tax=Phyllobacterium sp. OV277 TaxID=1882772 RepID=UPI00088950B2|nr:sugar phosphate isomerase/epimerase [Phyllobacterium sp. OV277]SDP89705.1 Sugar phosphate isomerase/epimerase [Phyllobacterium sp. OV277]